MTENAASAVLITRETASRKAERQDAGERDGIDAHIPSDAGIFRLLGLEDGVEGILELHHNAERGNQQEDDANRSDQPPEVDDAAPLSMASTAWLPVSPSRLRNWAVSDPRTASAPKKKPAMAVTMSKSGPSENTE